jgi:putative hydrolase of the HAD superfamily
MAKNYKHVFFDLDHTLWDFDKNSENTLLQLFNEFNLDQMGVSFQPFNQSYNAHNDRLWERFRKGYLKREELRWKRFWLALMDFKIADTALAHEISSAYLEILPTQQGLMPYAKEILEHCNGKYTLHLITNGFEATQRLKIQFSGIASYFTQMITSEKSNSMKPHPDIFDYALKATGAQTDNSIMIGDALEIDVLGAHNAGWDQVYYNPMKLSHDRKPTYEVHHLNELVGIL